jgi:hypothetical protein
MILFMSLLVALVIWGVVASVVALGSDGLNDVELARRNRSPEPFPRGR